MEYDHQLQKSYHLNNYFPIICVRKKELLGHQVIRDMKTILPSSKDLCINILQMPVPTSLGLTQNN